MDYKLIDWQIDKFTCLFCPCSCFFSPCFCSCSYPCSFLDSCSSPCSQSPAQMAEPPPDHQSAGTLPWWAFPRHLGAARTSSVGNCRGRCSSLQSEGWPCSKTLPPLLKWEGPARVLKLQAWRNPSPCSRPLHPLLGSEQWQQLQQQLLSLAEQKEHHLTVPGSWGDNLRCRSISSNLYNRSAFWRH